MAAQWVKHTPTMQEMQADAGSIPGSGRAPEEDMATHSSILTWRIQWTEEPYIHRVEKCRTGLKQLRVHAKYTISSHLN